MTTVDSAVGYAEQILAGEIRACVWVKRACERFFHDLDTAESRGFRFDESLAQRNLDFYSEVLTLSQGKWRGQPFNLLPWQAFNHINVYGWVKSEPIIVTDPVTKKSREINPRRFYTVYEEVARKQGKTTKKAGVGLYGFFAEGEGAAEVYAAATKREQAMKTFAEAVEMVKRSELLSGDIKISGAVQKPNRLYDLGSASFFVPLGRDSNTEDGLNVYVAIIDEYHAHKDSGMFDVLDSATGAREQALIWVVTTAGFDSSSPCHELRDYTTKVLDGFDTDDGVKDDRHFGVIYTLDGYDRPLEDGEEADDWQNPANWIKANPSLGHTVSFDDLQKKANKAASMPRAKNNFLTKHMNVWVGAASVWMNMQKWASQPVEAVSLESLAGRVCFGGLDLATTTDTCSLVLVSPRVDKPGLDVYARFWLPSESIREPTAKGTDLYKTWAREGWLDSTPGEVTDYEYIEATIREICEKTDVHSIAFDRYNASHLVQRLLNDEVCEMLGMGQGYVSMNAPVREIERLVGKRQLNHGGNPVLTFQIGNTATKSDPALNSKLDRDASKKSIDGPVALCMAIGRYLAEMGETGTADEGLLRVIG